MNRLWLISLLSLFFSSCATIFNTKNPVINLYSKQDSVSVSFGGDSDYAFTPVRLVVNRSRYPLSVHVQKDSINKQLLIPRKLSNAFWIGNILNGTFPVGFLIDLTNPRRYTYPQNVFFDIYALNQTNNKYSPLSGPTAILYQPGLAEVRKRRNTQGTFQVSVSIPESNYFVLQKEREIGGSFGFLGITAGVDYYYQHKKFVGVHLGTLTDFLVPFPAVVDYFGEYHRTFGNFIEMSRGFDVHNFSFYYGLSLANYYYEKRKTSSLFPVYQDEMIFGVSDNKMGLSTGVRYHFPRGFALGIKYMPSVYSLKNSNIQYGHLLFFDIIVNFWLRK